MTNLRTKKALAAKALKVGKNRIILNSEAIEEIKQAITKQDIKELVREGIISIKPVKGRKKIKKKKTKRGPGKIKKKVKKRKQEYVKITRKLRKYLIGLRDKGIVDRELYWELRKKIKMKGFKNKASFREYLKIVKVEVDGVAKSKTKQDKAKKSESERADKEKIERAGKKQNPKDKLNITKQDKK